MKFTFFPVFFTHVNMYIGFSPAKGLNSSRSHRLILQTIYPLNYGTLFHHKTFWLYSRMSCSLTHTATETTYFNRYASRSRLFTTVVSWWWYSVGKVCMWFVNSIHNWHQGVHTERKDVAKFDILRSTKIRCVIFGQNYRFKAVLRNWNSRQICDASLWIYYVNRQ